MRDIRAVFDDACGGGGGVSHLLRVRVLSNGCACDKLPAHERCAPARGSQREYFHDCSTLGAIYYAFLVARMAHHALSGAGPPPAARPRRQPRAASQRPRAPAAPCHHALRAAPRPQYAPPRIRAPACMRDRRTSRRRDDSRCRHTLRARTLRARSRRAPRRSRPRMRAASPQARAPQTRAARTRRRAPPRCSTAAARPSRAEPGASAAAGTPLHTSTDARRRT